MGNHPVNWDKEGKDKDSRRYKIIANADDLMGAFLYYDRKESDLRMYEIERAIIAGEITTEELIAIFRFQIESSVENARKEGK